MKDKALKEHKNIEELFKDSFNGFEAEPGANAWSNIQSQIGASASASASSGNTGVWAASGSKILTALISLGIVGLSIGGYYFFDSKGVKNKAARESQEAIPENNSKQEKAILETEKAKQESSEKEELVPPREKLKYKPKTGKLVKDEKALTNSSETKDLQANSKNSDNKEEAFTDTESAANSDQIISTSDEIISVTEENNDPVLDNSNNPINENSNPTQVAQPSKGTDQTSVETNDNDQREEAIETVLSEPDYSAVVNTFTPNGDGTNDMFEVKLEDVNELEVIILDKTGKEIHNWIGQYGFWDGKRPDNSLAPEGPYFYIISSKKEGKTFTKKGSIILKR